jgi:hypothetical protein
MKVRVLQGMATRRRRTPLEDAYDQFRPEQGNRLSQRTLASYDYRVDGFFSWLRSEHPQVRQSPVAPTGMSPWVHTWVGRPNASESPTLTSTA